MNENKFDDVIPIEFRHQVVMKVAMGLADGSMSVQVPSWVQNGKIFKRIGVLEGDLRGSINLYFSNTELTCTRDELEQRMFDTISNLRIWDALREKQASVTKLENDITDLSKKIDDNNELLTRVMGVLAEVIKRLDSKR